MRIVLRYGKYPCNRQVTGVLLFSQMEHIHQKQQGQSIVGHHGHQIVDRRDQRAGGHRRIDVDLMKQHGNHRPHKAGDHHGHHQRHPNAAGDQKSRPPRIALAHMDVDP